MPKKQKLSPVTEPVADETDFLADQSPLDNNQLRLAVYHLMTVLYRGGISEIHLGGLMRILGVDNEAAAIHDQEIVIMNHEAAEFVESLLDQYAEHLDAKAAKSGEYESDEEAESDESDEEADLPKVTIH